MQPRPSEEHFVQADANLGADQNDDRLHGTKQKLEAAGDPRWSPGA